MNFDSAAQAKKYNELKDLLDKRMEGAVFNSTATDSSCVRVKALESHWSHPKGRLAG